jgi:hypothetical protein
MSECKSWGPQDIFLIAAENVGVADGSRMTVESQDFIVEIIGE